MQSVQGLLVKYHAHRQARRQSVCRQVIYLYIFEMTTEKTLGESILIANAYRYFVLINKQPLDSLNQNFQIAA